ncbi:uncharacterized protein C8R40DRAFT_1213112 [Lentinula edodes]|uniref:uncharacterized protein n=1 Tax=Lentinula edodes TaxID=5353 RepID=UPI001E8D7EA9|nr:uncharacterized protein C8R40DRAFT_1213112 [Lentinula edodes]KAH7870251.1 hypothetical protein C8R40DRAFT_1213112 [Lentinula edodes]
MFPGNILPSLSYTPENWVDNNLKNLDDNGTIDVTNRSLGRLYIGSCEVKYKPEDVVLQSLTILFDAVVAPAKQISVSVQMFGFLVNSSVAMYSVQGCSPRLDAFSNIFTRIRVDHKQSMEEKLGLSKQNFNLNDNQNDVNDEWHQVVRIFFLGIPILDRRDNSRQRQYKIEVDREVYTTIDVLSDSAADSPLGCGTRVWKVKDSSGRTRILKDVWLKLNGQEGHRIHQAILADTKALNVEENDDFDDQLSQRVLRPMAYCRVRIGNEEDSTNTVMGGGYDLDNTIIMVEPVTFQQLFSVEPRGRMINILLHNQAPLLNCATTIYDERSLDNTPGFRAVVDVIKGWMGAS